MLRFYWELGRDIVELHVEQRWGDKVMRTLSADLQRENPNATGLSRTNLYYAKKFYQLYSNACQTVQQPVGQLGGESNEIVQQVAEQLKADLFSVPWGHHVRIMDKCSSNPQEAVFYVKQTLENGWSRDMLLNIMSTNLYERQGKAVSNFKRTIPDEDSDLAQEITRDPYDFAFTGITGRYNERKLKDALLNNITQFLLELGTGFAYVGKEYRLQIEDKEKFIDLLFYNLNLSCYVVVEVKIGEFDFADVGQIGGYVVACNHLLRKEGRDNPTIGLLICKQKSNMLAQYALESSSQPLGISEYELQQLYPKQIEGTMPTIEEIENQLNPK